jgi:magnesium transporter
MATQYDAPAINKQILDALRGDRPERAARLIEKLHPVDRAALFEELEPGTQEIYLSVVGPEGLADLLEHLDSDDRAATASRIPRSILARVLDKMTSDDAADVLQSLPASDAEALLAEMQTPARVRPLLQYAAETAGGLMTRGYVEVRPEMTAGQAIELLRSLPPASEVYYYLYVVSPASKLLGVLNVRQLIVAASATPVTDLMTSEIISVLPGTDQEECARLLQHYRLRALPVVDESGILRGTITADDIMDVLAEEATEDMFKMAGVGVQEWAFSPLRESVVRRVPWLTFNMMWAFAGAAAISLFEGSLERVAALAIFMPMIAGQAGNAGIQTATIVVRSMALGEVKLGDVGRVLTKEWALGAIKGLIFGSALGVIAYLWKGNVYLGLIAGTALALNMLVASTAGVLIPMTLRRLGFDPATIAGVFDTMLSDLMGFVIYLGLATIFISYLD